MVIMPTRKRKTTGGRRERIVVHIAKDFKDAEEWDLKFWQEQTPRMRIYALELMRADWGIIQNARENTGHKRL